MALIVATTVHAQQSISSSITCIPVQQFAKDKTQIECRLRTGETPSFIVAELGLPFHLTRVIKISSSYAAVFGAAYPAKLAENTIVMAAAGWGDIGMWASLQAVPFDSVSMLLETDDSMASVKKALKEKKVTIAFLSPNLADPMKPSYQTISLDQAFFFDSSLVLEGITQYVNPSILQFLRFAKSCYDQSPQACVTNLIQNF